MACLSKRVVYGVSFIVALQHSDKYFEPHSGHGSTRRCKEPCLIIKRLEPMYLHVVGLYEELSTIMKLLKPKCSRHIWRIVNYGVVAFYSNLK